MFWNREQLPPELRDKRPEEIIAALAKLKELETKNTEFETAKKDLETKLNTQQTEFEATRSRLQELEANIANAQQQYQQQQQQQQPEPASVWTDPDKYIDQRTMGTQWTAVQAGRNSARLMFKDELSPRDSKIFQKYASEVDKAMQSYHPAYQINPENWKIAFNYVKGLHDTDIAKMEAEGTPFFSEPASRTAQPEPPPEEKLSAEEEEVCKRFHWDPEGYLQRKKERSLHQSERGAFARYSVPERVQK